MTCPECNGAGVVFYYVVIGGPGSWRGPEIEEQAEDCEMCDATGELPDEDE